MDWKSRSFEMAKKIKTLRENRGISHEKLSVQLKEQYGLSVHKDSLITYEISDEFRSRAKKLSNLKMKSETLFCLADFYGVSVDWLLGRTGDHKLFAPAVDELGLSVDAVHRIRDRFYSEGELSILSNLIASVEFWDIIHEVRVLQKLRDSKERDPSISREIHVRGKASETEKKLRKEINYRIRIRANHTL